MTKQERKELRLSQLKACSTPEEVAYDIWTVEFEKAVGDRSSYRIPFINWIKCYKNGEKPQWKYTTPKELAEAIWQPFLDDDTMLFQDLRTTLINWIENYRDNG